MMRNPRRVVHAVRSDAFAGVERYICDVVRELDGRGWDVRVVGGDVEAMRRALPGHMVHVPATSTAAVFRALVRQPTAPLVHAHMTAAEGAAVASRLVTGSRVVSTRHFSTPRGGARRLMRWSGRAIARGIDSEIAISDFVGQSTGGRAIVIPNGVPDSDAPGNPASRRILVMQRLQKEKDTRTAVLAFAESQLADDGWNMVIAGRGPLKTELQGLVRRLGLIDSVRLLGFVPEPEMLRADAAILLAPAPAEPFGLSVAEAMAAGVPVIAADGGAHREVLGETGLLFPPGNVSCCAAHLRSLAQLPLERARLGEAGRERQRAEYSINRHVDALEQVYDGRTCA